MAHIVPCPRPALEAKLKAVNQSQQSIETTSKWMMFYKDDASSVVSCWQEEFRLAPSDRALALLYLASHTIQESRKKSMTFTDAYSGIVLKAFTEFGRRGEEKHRKAAERIVKVWEDRRIFSSSLCKSLKDALMLGSSSAAGPSSSSGQPSSPQGSSDHAKKLLHAAGKIPEALYEVLKAEHASSSLLLKCNEIPSDISLTSSTSTLDQVTSARDVHTSCSQSLHHEVSARKRAINELKACLARHELDLVKVEEQHRLIEATRSQLDSKARLLSQPGINPLTSTGLPSLPLPLPPVPPPMQMITNGEGGQMLIPPTTEQIQAMLEQAAATYPPGVLPPPDVFFASLLNHSGQGQPLRPHGVMPSAARPEDQQRYQGQQYPQPPFPPYGPGGGYPEGLPPIPATAEEVEAQLMSHLQDPETRALVARSLAEGGYIPLPPAPQQGHGPNSHHQQANINTRRSESASLGFGSQISVASEGSAEVEYDPYDPL